MSEESHTLCGLPRRPMKLILKDRNQRDIQIQNRKVEHVTSTKEAYITSIRGLIVKKTMKE